MCAAKYSPDEEQTLRAFGVALRALRVQMGWSQEVLAEISGLHRTYVGSVERGERNVSLLNIVVLSRTLGMSIRDLAVEMEKYMPMP